MMDRWGACDYQAIANPATTLAGALTSIEWAKDELMTFGFNASEPDQGTRVILALIDGALSILRSQGGAA